MTEVKKGNKTKLDFYLTIYNYIKLNSKLPLFESLKLTSKQALNYYIATLKKKGYIKKIGYGVWEVVKDYNLEVKIRTTQVTLSKTLTLSDLKNIRILKLKKILRQHSMDKCIFCDSTIYQMHHIISKSKGGTDSIYNLIPACPNHYVFVHNMGYTPSMKKKLMEYRDFVDITLKRTDKIRGHAFMFHLKIPTIPNWRRRAEYLDKKGIKYTPLNNLGGGQKILLKGNKTHLKNKCILIYDKDNYLCNSSESSKHYAIEEFIERIEKLETLLNTSFKINGKYKFKVCRQHYGKMQDTLARHYNKENKKLRVYNDEGLWFIIDKSLTLDEAETVNYKTADKDMDDCIVPFFNSIKDKKGFTADLILESFKENNNQIKALVEDRKFWAEHQKSHVAAIKELAVGVKKQTAGIQDLIKTIKRLKAN